MESLQSPCIHTQIHWSSSTPVCFPSWRTRVQSPGGYLCGTGILLLALSRYIGDPDVIVHCGLVWGRLRPELSLGRRADNVIIPLDHTQLFCPGFTLAASLPSSFTIDIIDCWGGALWRACNLPAFIHSLPGPVGQPFASCHEGPRCNPQGVLIWNWDSPVSVVSLQVHSFLAVVWAGTEPKLSRPGVETNSFSSATLEDTFHRGHLDGGIWCSCSCLKFLDFFFLSPSAAVCVAAEPLLFYPVDGCTRGGFVRYLWPQRILLRGQLLERQWGHSGRIVVSFHDPTIHDTG